MVGFAPDARCSLRITDAHVGPARSLLVDAAADGGVLLVSSDDDKDGVCRWDPRSGALVWRSEAAVAGVNALTAVRVPGGRQIVAVAGEEGVARLDARTGEVLPECDPCDTVWDLTAVELPDGRTALWGAGHGCQVLRWDPLTGRSAGEPLPHVGGARSVTSGRSANGRGVVVSGGDDGVIFWDAVTGESLGSALRDIDDGPTTAVVLVPMPDGTTMLVADNVERLHRVDVVSGRETAPPLVIGDNSLRGAVRLLGRPMLVLDPGEADGVRLWDVLTERFVGEPLPAFGVAVGVVDGTTLLATGSREGHVQLWELGPETA
jgi:WD40 repeat protein